MKALKILYVYYGIIILTPVIYLIRIFWGEKLENEIYLKQTGQILKRCELVPTFIIIPIVLCTCLGLFLLTKEIQRKIDRTKHITAGGYFKLALITVFIILFVFVDYEMI